MVNVPIYSSTVRDVFRGGLQGLSSPIDQWNLWISWCFEALKGAVPPPRKNSWIRPCLQSLWWFFFQSKTRTRFWHWSNTKHIFQIRIFCFLFQVSFHNLQFGTHSYSVFSYFTILNTILFCLFIFYNSEHHLILSFHILQFWTPSYPVFSYFTILNTILFCLFIIYNSEHHLVLSFHILQFWTPSHPVFLYFTILNSILSCIFIFYNSEEHHLILSFHSLQFWTPSYPVFS